MKPNAVIVDLLRSPMGRSKGGVFRQLRAEKLSALLMQAILARQPGLDPTQLDDVIWGCVQQTLEQGFNIARNAALLAGIPQQVPAQTVNRLCGSSMQALHSAVQAIEAEQGQCFLVGGVEHMGHVPMTHGLDPNPELSHQVARGSGVMGITAEVLARQFQISRQAQDEFALRSHQRAAKATAEGAFAREILPVLGVDGSGLPLLVKADEVIRADSSLADLARLKPAFDPRGSVTAGNSSALSDGAAALLVMSESRARELGLSCLARVKAQAVTGCSPSTMGLGPVFAVQKLLAKTGLSLADIGLFELNEAFAAQSLAVVQQLKLSEVLEQKVNLQGGAIALGHPLGCSGARISVTLLNQMRVGQVQWGVAAMCIGFGQGIATLFELMDG